MGGGPSLQHRGARAEGVSWAVPAPRLQSLAGDEAPGRRWRSLSAACGTTGALSLRAEICFVPCPALHQAAAP